jgi:ATP-binding cassette subfamily B protein
MSASAGACGSIAEYKASNEKVLVALRLIWENAASIVKVRLAAVLLLVILGATLTALGPVALKMIVDGLSQQAKSSTATSQSIAPLTLIGLYVLSQWAAQGIGQVWLWVYARAERRMFGALSGRFFEHLARLPLQYHLDRETGATSQILNDGLQGYQMILHHLVFTFLPVAAEIGTVIVVLAHLGHLEFIFLFLAALISLAMALIYTAGSTSKAGKEATAAQVDATAVMTDSLLNYETMKYFTAEAILQQRVSRALLRMEFEWVNLFRRFALNGVCVATIFGIFFSVIALYAWHEVKSGRMTVGGFVLVNTYMLRVMTPIEMLSYGIQAISQGVAMLNKIITLFQQTPEPPLGDHQCLPMGPASVEFSEVTLSYRPEHQVLRGISFKIAAGETLGIVGASGSGKSSIVRLLFRLIEANSGQILLDGVPIGELTLRSLRQSIAVVPQDTHLINDTIGYNVAFGRAGSSQEEVEQAARLARLHDFIMTLPEKYQTAVGERGLKLSGGERQRIAIARAAMKQPRVYVFDEATSSLDSKTEREILRNMNDIARSCTSLVIAHRLSTVVHADTIIFLENGTVVERGTHSSLLRMNGKYAALWHAQQTVSVVEAVA